LHFSKLFQIQDLFLQAFPKKALAIIHLTEHRYPDTASFVDSEWSGSAGAPASSIKETEPAADGFGSIQDMLDGVSHVVDGLNRRFASQNVDALDRYIKGHVAAYSRVKSSRDGYPCDLLFVAVPSLVSPVQFGNRPFVTNPTVWTDNSAKVGSDGAKRKGHKSEVFLGISDFVQCHRVGFPAL
jgi:3',5'-cyclic AMP phosphodiesterase CpdA